MSVQPAPVDPIADLALVDLGCGVPPCGCEASEEAERLLGLALDRLGAKDADRAANRALGDEILAYLEGLERGRAEASR